MDAAEDLAVLLHAVPDNPASTMRTNRCQSVNRTFEAVEGVTFSGHDHFECFVVLVFTSFTCSHTKCLSRAVSVPAVSDLFRQGWIEGRRQDRHLDPGLLIPLRDFSLPNAKLNE